MCKSGCMGDRGSEHKVRWYWGPAGSQLFGSDGSEYQFVDVLSRGEVKRLLKLKALEAVRVECEGGVAEWVGASQAQRVWVAVGADLDNVEDWRPPHGASGTQPYQAHLWRADDGRHVLMFINE